MPLSKCRVGCTRLVSNVQASPRSKSIHSPVPVKPVWPMVSAEQACAARPAGELALPAAGAVLEHRCADRRQHRVRGAAGRARLARNRARPRPCRTARHGPSRRPAPQQFSSCTSPFSTRPRHMQRSVATAGPGGGPKPRPSPSGQAPSGCAGQPLDRDAEQDEVDVGIDRRGVCFHSRCSTKARSRVGIVAIGVDRLDRGKERAVRQAVAEGQRALVGAGDIVLAQVGDRGR